MKKVGRVEQDSRVRFIPRAFDLKSFGKEVVYFVRSANSMDAIRAQRVAREALLQGNKFRVPRVPQLRP